MNWYVIYTKPKWEKKVAEQLIQRGIECYCPLVTQTKQWSDRKKKVQVPLFNSYVFVHLNEEDRNLVFQSSGVVRYLFWLAKPAVVRKEEIDVIKNWLSSPNQYEITVSNIKIGDKIVLDSGPFQSREAIVKEINKNNYVLVLEALGCVLKIEMV